MNAYIRHYKTVNPTAWAEANLSAEEYTSFQQAALANNRLWEEYRRSGLITVSPIMEESFQESLNTTIQIQIGEKIELSEGVSPSQLIIDEQWEYWLSRYNSEVDPEFRENILIDAP